MKKLFIVILIAFIAGCAAYKPLAPSQADAERASKKFPGVTLAQLNEGKTIFESNCGKCHSLKRPFTKPEEEVREAVPRMAKKAHIDSRQEDLVLKYLLTMHNVQPSK